MAILAIRCSQFANGVSKLHGHVSRDMWSGLWPAVPTHEVPIGHVTNGVHARTWISHELVDILNRYVAPDWQLDPTDHHLWSAIDDIPSEHLWLYRQRQRESLITWVRWKVRKQLEARGATATDIEEATGALSTDALTIGFARRFATYKRGTLLMHDKERLRALLNSTDRPVQILIAGKAHPADKPGKELIRELVKLSESDPDFRRVVFLEDYDMEIGRRLVQGCDIWLNTPRRGMEASGTSGMKAAMNGGINVSILDGWWDEAYESGLGFAIGGRETYDDEDAADQIESRGLYDLLERQILPEFYGRSASGVPKAWMNRVKATMAKLTPQYSTNRMVADYTERYYLNAHGIGESLAANALHEAKDLSAQIARYREHWGLLRVRSVRSDVEPAMPLRKEIRVEASIDLGGLRTEEVAVQLYAGSVTAMGSLVHPEVSPMTFAREEDGSCVFTGSFTPTDSGRKGFTVRVVPNDGRLLGTLLPGLITWDAEAPMEKLTAPASEQHENAVA
jgi:starch phosphorylase